MTAVAAPVVGAALLLWAALTWGRGGVSTRVRAHARSA